MGEQRDFINSILSEVARDCIDKIRWSAPGDYLHFYEGAKDSEFYTAGFKYIKKDFVLNELVPALNSGKFVFIRDSASNTIGVHVVSYFISQDSTVEWKVEKLQEALDL